MLSIRSAARYGTMSAVQNVGVDLLEVYFALRIQGPEAGGIGKHLLDRNVDALDRAEYPEHRADGRRRAGHDRMVRERRPDLPLVAVHLDGAPGASLLASNESAECAAGRQEQAQQLLGKRRTGLAHVARRVGNLHEVSLARSVGPTMALMPGDGRNSRFVNAVKRWSLSLVIDMSVASAPSAQTLVRLRTQQRNIRLVGDLAVEPGRSERPGPSSRSCPAVATAGRSDATAAPRRASSARRRRARPPRRGTTRRP